MKRTSLVFFLVIIFIGFYNYKLDAATVSYKSDVIEKWFTAAASGDLKIIQEMLDIIDINIKNGDNCTALMLAAQFGNENIVKLLLQAPEVDITVFDKSGTNACGFAIENNHQNIVKLFLQMPKFDINSRDNTKRRCTPLINAVIKNRINIVKLLLQAPAAGAEAGAKAAIDINARDVHGSTALICASYPDKQEILKLLLKQPKIDINAQNKSGGSTCLSLATFNGLEDVVQELLKFDTINLNTQNIYGDTALITAVARGHETIVQLLVQHPGIDTNIKNNRGDTALTIAAFHNKLNMVELLLQAPAIDVNIPDINGATALQYATFRGYEDMARFLLNVPGIDITSAHYPMAYTNPIIAKLLQEKKQKLAQKAFEAIKTNDLETVKSVTAQIGVNFADSHGETLIDKAFLANRPAIIKYVLQHANDPQELLARFPFESINPSSPIFVYIMDLAYGIKADWPEEQEKTCAHCSRPNCIKRCSLCKNIFYCSTACQKADWLIHKKRCKRVLKVEID